MAALVAMGFAAFGTLKLYGWFAQSSTLRVAVAAGSSTVEQFLEAWAKLQSQRTDGVKLVLLSYPDTQTALTDLRAGHVQLAAIRLDRETRGDIRAIAALSTRFLILQPTTSDAAGTSDPDLEFARTQLAPLLGARANFIDLRPATGRSGIPPKGMVSVETLKLNEELSSQFWFLGAARDEPDEEEKDWRLKALSISRYLVATDGADRQLIHDVSLALADASRSLRSELPAARAVTLAPLEDGKGILRAHDGVARYLNREGQSFFERYADWVYVGMSVLGLVATGIGALVASARDNVNDNGRRHLRQMQRLIEYVNRHENADARRVRRLASTLALRFTQDVVARRVTREVVAAFSALQTALASLLISQDREPHVRKLDQNSKRAISGGTSSVE